MYISSWFRTASRAAPLTVAPARPSAGEYTGFSTPQLSPLSSILCVRVVCRSCVEEAEGGSESHLAPLALNVSTSARCGLVQGFVCRLLGALAEVGTRARFPVLLSNYSPLFPRPDSLAPSHSYPPLAGWHGIYSRSRPAGHANAALCARHR